MVRPPGGTPPGGTPPGGSAGWFWLAAAPIEGADSKLVKNANMGARAQGGGLEEWSGERSGEAARGGGVKREEV